AHLLDQHRDPRCSRFRPCAASQTFFARENNFRRRGIARRSVRWLADNSLTLDQSENIPSSRRTRATYFQSSRDPVPAAMLRLRRKIRQTYRPPFVCAAFALSATPSLSPLLS